MDVNLHYDHGVASPTVIVVVRVGPVKRYPVPGLSGVLPPGITTLYEAFKLHFANVESVNAVGLKLAVSVFPIEAGICGVVAPDVIEAVRPESKATSQLVPVAYAIANAEAPDVSRRSPKSQSSEASLPPATKDIPSQLTATRAPCTSS
jgi:hypothetical protein